MLARSYVRPLDGASADEVDLVARRMRATLVEVLGEERGTALYSLDWLRDRVRFHLDPARSTAAVFLAIEDGVVAGHTIVRVERELSGDALGLFSTTYVTPPWRRRAVATRLLLCGERWMLERGLPLGVTYTAASNAKLIGLYAKHGYGMRDCDGEMVRLERVLASRPRPPAERGTEIGRR